MSESSADYAPTTRNTGGPQDRQAPRSLSNKSSPIWSKLERRILELSYKKKTSHIGSCLTAVWLIDRIFAAKRPQDIFILSAGHAGLALYVVLEKYGYGNAEELFDKHGVHPNTDPEHGIVCSSGSLGHGLGVAIGFALADPDRHVYCLMSDGECAEGSVWEALRVADSLKLKNLLVSVNANGYSATDVVDVERLDRHFDAFDAPVAVWETKQKGLYGLDAHYHVLTKEEYDAIQ